MATRECESVAAHLHIVRHPCARALDVDQPPGQRRNLLVGLLELTAQLTVPSLRLAELTAHVGILALLLLPATVVCVQVQGDHGEHVAELRGRDVGGVQQLAVLTARRLQLTTYSDTHREMLSERASKRDRDRESARPRERGREGERVPLWRGGSSPSDSQPSSSSPTNDNSAPAPFASSPITQQRALRGSSGAALR